MKKFVALVMGMILACSEAAVGNMTVLASDVTEEAGSVQEDISLEEEVLSENENNEESTEEFGSEEIDVAESSESETEEDAAGIFDDTDAAEDIGVSVFEENENDSVEIDPIVEDAERSEDEVREAVEKIEDETVNDVLFDETDYFSYSENEDGTITIYNYNDPEGYLDEIPGTIDGKKVTVIGDLAFNNCSIDDDLVIPSSVTTIEYGAFENCSIAGNLIIPSSVTTIGTSAFERCSFAGRLTIPSSVTMIGDSAFQECESSERDDELKYIYNYLTIQSGVKEIGDKAFYDCSYFTGDLTIPSSVTKIGEEAFSGCSGFNGKLTIQPGVRTIGRRAFEGCRGFTGNLTIPSSLTAIDFDVFSDCSGLKGTLTIPSSVKTINEFAFYRMYGISKIINNSKIEINARNFIETEDKYFVDSKKKSVLWDGKIGNGTYISAKAVRVKSISLKLKQTNLVKGKTINLSKQYSINPSNVTDKTVWWESSNNKVATVSQKGVVSGVKAGTTTITVGTRDGQKKATCKVTVTNPVVKVKSVKLNKKTASIKAGKTVTLKATITPSNATTKTVTWKTSNKKIATVTSKGVVKGIKTGTATITVTTKDGKKTAKCKATVK